MPRVARFRIAALEELYRQLRFAPAATRVRQMNAAERLHDDIEHDATYPHDYIVYRITGYRPELASVATMFPGEALRHDLVSFVQRLSDGLHLAPDYDGRNAVPMGDVAVRLNVSLRTLQRYRREGLLCHYVRFTDDAGGKQLACFNDALEKFMKRNDRRLAQASAFDRMSDVEIETIIVAARTLKQEHDCSAHEAARRLHRQFGRAAETIRLLLKRHDARAHNPIFSERGPLTRREKRLVHRAWMRGIDAARIANRFDCTAATVRRTVCRRQADLLLAIDLSYLHMPTFDRDDAEAVILASQAVQSNLDDILPLDDAVALIDAAHAQKEGDESTEEALLAAVNLLKKRAIENLDALPEWPGWRAVDRIETDLRWVSRLCRRLLSLSLPIVIERIEQNLHRPLRAEPGERITTLLVGGVDIALRVINSTDPGRGQRLSRRMAFAVDVEMGSRDASAASHRAAARHAVGELPLNALLPSLTPWDELLELRADLASSVHALDDDDARLVTVHYGLRDDRPRSLDEIARDAGVPMRIVSRRLRAVLTLLRAHARSTGSEGA